MLHRSSLLQSTLVDHLVRHNHLASSNLERLVQIDRIGELIDQSCRSQAQLQLFLIDQNQSWYQFLIEPDYRHYFLRLIVGSQFDYLAKSQVDHCFLILSEQLS